MDIKLGKGKIFALVILIDNILTAFNNIISFSTTQGHECFHSAQAKYTQAHRESYIINMGEICFLFPVPVLFATQIVCVYIYLNMLDHSSDSVKKTHIA